MWRGGRKGREGTIVDIVTRDGLDNAWLLELREQLVDLSVGLKAVPRVVPTIG